MILCCGEALIDMLLGEHCERACLRALCRRRRSTRQSRRASRRADRVFLRSFLRSVRPADPRRPGVDVGSRYADVSARLTTLAFVRLVDGHATYTFYDENTAGRMLTEADLPALDDEIGAMLFGAISSIPNPAVRPTRR